MIQMSYMRENRRMFYTKEAPQIYDYASMNINISHINGYHETLDYYLKRQSYDYCIMSAFSSS